MNKLISIINNLKIENELELLVLTNMHMLRDTTSYWDETYQTNLYKTAIERVRKDMNDNNNASQQVFNILRNDKVSYYLNCEQKFWLITAVYCIVNSDSITLQNIERKVVIEI